MRLRLCLRLCLCTASALRMCFAFSVAAPTAPTPSSEYSRRHCRCRGTSSAATATASPGKGGGWATRVERHTLAFHARMATAVITRLWSRWVRHTRRHAVGTSCTAVVLKRRIRTVKGVPLRGATRGEATADVGAIIATSLAVVALCVCCAAGQRAPSATTARGGKGGRKNRSDDRVTLLQTQSWRLLRHRTAAVSLSKSRVCGTGDDHHGPVGGAVRSSGHAMSMGRCHRCSDRLLLTATTTRVATGRRWRHRIAFVRTAGIRTAVTVCILVVAAGSGKCTGTAVVTVISSLTVVTTI